MLIAWASQQQGSSGPPGPGPELLIDRDLPDETNWIPGHAGAAVDPEIIGGQGVMTAESEGNTQFFTQTLAGGSQIAGTYNVGFDLIANSDRTIIRLLGAADEARGFFSFEGTGANMTDTVAASGEVSKFQVRVTNTDAIFENPTMNLA